MITLTKRGGLTFFRWGRFGGSVYLRRSDRDNGHIPALMVAILAMGIVGITTMIEGNEIRKEVEFRACLERIFDATARDGRTRECGIN